VQNHFCVLFAQPIVFFQAVRNKKHGSVALKVDTECTDYDAAAADTTQRLFVHDPASPGRHLRQLEKGEFPVVSNGYNTTATMLTSIESLVITIAMAQQTVHQTLNMPWHHASRPS
jgi:hypothetical protein